METLQWMMLIWSSICRWVLQLDEEGSIFYSTAPRWTNCPDNGMVENCIPGELSHCNVYPNEQSNVHLFGDYSFET